MLVPVVNGIRGIVVAVDLPASALVEVAQQTRRPAALMHAAPSPERLSARDVACGVAASACTRARALPADVSRGGVRGAQELSQALKRLTDIDVESQVLMCEWEPETGLISRRAVSSYGLPRQDEQSVFVFNKAWFRQGAAGPPDEGAPVVRAELPTQEQSLLSSCSTVISRAHQNADDPMRKATVDFLAKFVHFQAVGEAYAAAAAARVQACEQVRDAVGLQRRASALALSSLQRYFAAVGLSVDKLEAEVAAASELVRVRVCVYMYRCISLDVYMHT